MTHLADSLLILNAALPAEFAPPGSPGASAPPGFALASIRIVEGRIVEVSAGTGPVAGDQPQLDAAGSIVLPGFVDVHVHGAAGCDTMDATPEALARMAAFDARHGVTAFLATTMTDTTAATLAAVRTVAAAPNTYADGATILGVHLEGPFISPHFPGAQRADAIRPPDVREFLELVEAGPVRMITLAPEMPGAREVIAAAVDRGIAAVLGHTAATYDQCAAAVAWGVRQATHTYNAMTGLHHRKPGTLGAVLSDDRLYAQLIADNIHVHPAAMNILARCKGMERTVLITDAMRAAGLPPGTYELGGQPVTVRDGQCRLADGTLAGSILTMERGLANFAAAAGLPLAKAWPASSRTPAASLGLDSVMGSIRPGYRGDLVILDSDLAVVATVVGGRVVHQA